MSKIVLDTNIWHRLAGDDQARERIRSLCEASALEIIVSDTLLRELEVSAFGGVPDWFPTNVIKDSVFVLDHSRLGFARLGGGSVFAAHRGASKQISDAVIVDAADNDADIFVSEDRRARERYAKLRDRGRALSYPQFRGDILGL
jgi:predicted nucleic acid-binding protein